MHVEGIGGQKLPFLNSLPFSEWPTIHPKLRAHSPALATSRRPIAGAKGCSRQESTRRVPDSASPWSVEHRRRGTGSNPGRSLVRHDDYTAGCRAKCYAVTQQWSRPRDANTMPFSPLAPVPGTRIGVYDITTQIGAGGICEAVNVGRPLMFPIVLRWRRAQQARSRRSAAEWATTRRLIDNGCAGWLDGPSSRKATDER